MKHLRVFVLVFAVAFVGTTILPQAKADERNHETILTFSGPVELPGVVLPAGTYVFKLADSLSDRNVVQVFNKEENHIYATILAIPDYRMEPTDKPVITFEERMAGAPQAIKAWFYPGSTYGQEFVYPKLRAMDLAKANQQDVPSMPAEMEKSVTEPAQSAEVQAMEHAPVTAIQPSGNEGQPSEDQPSEVQPSETFPPMAAAPTQMTMIPKTLPKTASPLPWFLLIGTIALSGSLALRLAAKKAS